MLPKVVRVEFRGPKVAGKKYCSQVLDDIDDRLTGRQRMLVGTFIRRPAITPENKYSRVQMRLVEVETGKVLTAFSHILRGIEVGSGSDMELKPG